MAVLTEYADSGLSKEELVEAGMDGIAKAHEGEILVIEHHPLFALI